MKILIEKLYIFIALHHFENEDDYCILLFLKDICIYSQKCITSKLASHTVDGAFAIFV